MKSITLLTLILLTTGSGTVLLAHEWIVRRARTQPRLEPGIPRRDYQFQSRSRSETAISRTAVLLRSDLLERAEAATAAEVPPGARLHEETTRRTVTPLRGPRPGEAGHEESHHRFERHVDRWHEGATPDAEPIKLYLLNQSHLAINHCAVSQVAFQIQENGTWMLSLRGDQNRRPEPGEPAPYNPFLYIKRNEFLVRLRCFGNFGTEPTETAVEVGKPVLADLGPLTFWVENGEPRYIRRTGKDDRIRKYYSLIERIELEFFYR